MEKPGDYQNMDIARSLSHLHLCLKALSGGAGFPASADHSFSSFGHQQLIDEARADIERLRKTVSVASNEGQLQVKVLKFFFILSYTF